MTIDLTMPEETYHAHPALSSTGARRILKSPAKFHYWQTHPAPTKPEFDLGHAVHAKVLGVGASTIVIPENLLAKNGAATTKAAQKFQDEARANGLIPVKADLERAVHAMAEAVLTYGPASEILHQDGDPEVSLFATDPTTGVDLRARYDFFGARSADLKTTGKDADPETFARTAFNLGYDVQECHYEDVLEFATGEKRPFVFIVVETEPPYLVAVHMLDREYREIGRRKAERARAIFAQCLATDTWPGYPEEINPVRPPMSAVYDFQDHYAEASA